jgi:hypothetical protein
MAEEYIKKSSGLMPVGNTQGLMIPQDLPYASIPYLSTTVPTNTNTDLNLGDFIVSHPFVTKSGNTLVVQEDGVYIVDMGGLNTPSGVTLRWVFIMLNTSTYLRGSMVEGDTQDVSFFPITLVNLKKDDRLTFRAFNHGAATYTNYRPITICQLKRDVPYIIANKGALVSSPNSGNIAFDVDTGIMRYNPYLISIYIGSGIYHIDLQDGDTFDVDYSTYTFSLSGPAATGGRTMCSGTKHTGGSDTFAGASSVPLGLVVQAPNKYWVYNWSIFVNRAGYRKLVNLTVWLGDSVQVTGFIQKEITT